MLLTGRGNEIRSPFLCNFIVEQHRILHVTSHLSYYIVFLFLSQVQRTNSMLQTCKLLWIEEGVWMFSKGLSARLVQSVMFSFSIILGYETIKRFSVKSEYKHQVRW
uniref:Solute carrier family 25 member 44 n=1 Tax=Cacopsylla melanoneura TaxID=428564 RepID=A0A8D8TWJ0_9HEMI